MFDKWLFKDVRDKKKIENINCESDFCRYAPTRAFWLDSLHGFLKVDKLKEAFITEVARLEDALRLNYYEQDPDFAKLRLPEPQNRNILPFRGVYVPLVTEINDKHKYLPDVSFSGFEELSGSKIGKIDFEKYENIGKILKTLLKYETNIYYILQIDPLIKIEGKSFELGYFVNRWLQMNKDAFNRIPNICCTGEITQDGNLSKIERAEIKIKAALTKNFDYIFLPEDNRNEYDTDPRIIYFQNIYQVIIFLSENTDDQKSKNKIKAWLNGDNSEPSNEFERYFKTQTDPTENSLKTYKDLFEHKSAEEQYEKLQTIVRNYAAYALKQFDSNALERAKVVNLIFPRSISFFYLTSLLKENNFDYKEKSIYNSAADFFLSSDPDVTLASGLLSDTDFIEQEETFEKIRRRYPKLLCLLFKNSAQLLYLLSCLKSKNHTEDRLLNSVLSEIENYDIQTNEIESEVTLMNKVLKVFSDSVNLKDTNFITNSKKIALLYKARKNFLTQNCTEAAQVCFTYFEKILEKVEENKAYRQIAKDFFDDKNITDSQKTVLNKPAYTHLSKVRDSNKQGLKSYKDEIKKIEDAAKSLLCQFLKNTFKIKEKHGFYPQPAFNIFSYFQSNKSNYSLQSFFNTVLGGFGKHFQNSEAKTFKAECLAFWAGQNFEYLDAERTLNLTKPFAFPYYIGTLKRHFSTNANKIDPLIKKLTNFLTTLDTNQTGYIRHFLWLYFLDNDCKKFLNNKIYSLLKEKLEHIKSRKNSDQREKSILELSFLCDLFGCETGDNRWQSELKSYLKNPRETRRTTQLLAPVSLLIKGKHTCDEIFTDSSNSLNNSQFVTEFIRVFCLNANNTETLFVPICRQNSSDKQVFDTLALLSLRNRPDLLKKYVLSRINDLPNLFLAFKLTAGSL
ncbi:MAG: hypothetical protein PHF08_04380 [Candidatus Riflebacteria bacterium]|nr:hypothetical protein [Candidatus Riflebacteria bacterium]